MKVLILTDRDWALAKRKIEAELNCAEFGAAWVRGFRKRNGCRYLNEAHVRKRHIEAIRLARVLNQ